MKKLLTLVLAVAMIFSLASFAFAEEGERKKTVGIAMPTDSRERWNRSGQYLKEQFEAAGFDTILIFSDDDADRQNNDIQTMIADGAEVLVIAPVDGNSLSQTLADAKDAGILVIAYDRLIMNTDAVSCYVSFDNYKVGALQGEFIKDALDLDNAQGPFTIEFIAGDAADNNAVYVFNGTYDTLKPYIDEGKLIIPSGKTSFEQVATERWSADKAFENFQSTLAACYSDGTQLDAVACSNDSLALGVAKAITSDYAGSNQPIITGQDGAVANLRNIVDGIQTMTVYKNVSDEADVTLKVVLALLAGETPGEKLLGSLDAEAAFDTETYDNGMGVVPSFLLVPWTVTRNNLDTLADTGLYVWDGDYLVAE